MVFVEAYSGNFPRRRPSVLAAFARPDVDMKARKGPGAPRPRLTDAVRYVTGRIKYHRAPKEEKPVSPSILACIRRIEGTHPDLAREAIADPNGEIVQRVVNAARDARHDYPLGVLYLEDLLCPPTPEESEDETKRRKERALLLERAGLLYAGLHFLVWSGSGAPLRNVQSHLSKVLPDLVGPPTELTPEKVEKERRAREYRLQKCRRALAAASPMGLAQRMVDLVCIELVPLSGPHRSPHSPTMRQPLKHLRLGLSALVDALALDSNSPRRAAPPLSSEVAPEELPAVPIRRRAKVPLDTIFSPISPERPEPSEVRDAVSRLLRGPR